MSKLKIAIQKSGRLSEKSLDLLRKCDIRFSNGISKLQSQATNFPLEILFIRDDDIPGYVQNGIADIGIIGENEILEKGSNVKKCKSLGFARCRMSLAIPKSQAYQGIQFFEGKTIATSYPNILKSFLRESKIEAGVEYISGSVEIAPGIGLADGIFDIVSTGSTLLTNGLKEVYTILESEAVLISHKDLPSSKSEILDDLLFRIAALQSAATYKYILLNAPNNAIPAIINVLPGIKSPTLLPLATEGWSSMHSVVREDDFWETIHQLKNLGAEGILVTPIEKLIQ